MYKYKYIIFILLSYFENYSTVYVKKSTKKKKISNKRVLQYVYLQLSFHLNNLQAHYIKFYERDFWFTFD